RFADGLSSAGFEVLNDVVLNQVLVSFGEPEVTQRVIEAIQEDGTCWCGGTVWQGRTAMRISVSSWATTEADGGRRLARIVRLAPAQAGRCVLKVRSFAARARDSLPWSALRRSSARDR